MTYKTIIVHLDCGKRRNERLDLALRFAGEFDAHLIGMFSLDLYFGFGMAADAGSVLVEAELQRREICMQEAQSEFFSKCASRADKVEWRYTEDDAAGEVTLAARSADLVILGQADPETAADDGTSPSFVADVVLNSGKPVLIVPYAGHFENVGRRMMVAWTSAREAGRALTDSLPMLERSEAVEVVLFDEGDGGVNHSDVQTYLQDHGVNATVKRYPGDELSAGELILSRASDDEADCIVMGAYGHSRLKETLLGGATKTVMKLMTVPVMMSH